jgi:imidazoleglycerol-phosphate dehydratase/histidinol-phosphatase
MQKYAFVDRDGTIIWEPPRPPGTDPRETFPLQGPNQVRFLDGALEGLRTLMDTGHKLVLVTNQTFLGTPRHPRDIFDHVMAAMRHGLDEHGIRFEFEMVCPHGPDDGCECRKPKIGGLKEFLARHKGKIDFAHSFMFGDRDTDREFAENLGVHFMKVETNGRFELPSNL